MGYNFRDFLLSEDHAYLGQKIGDLLTSLHELESDMQGMGVRHLAQSSEQIVQQIRRILHTSWPKSETKFLPPLQKAGVAIMKAIEEKDDLKSVLSGVKSEIEQLSVKLGVPQNSLGTKSVEPTPPPQAVSKPEEKLEQPQGQEPGQQPQQEPTQQAQPSQPPKQQGPQPPPQ